MTALEFIPKIFCNSKRVVMTTGATVIETADTGNKMNLSVNLCSVLACLTVVPLIDFLTKPEPHFLAILECFFSPLTFFLSPASGMIEGSLLLRCLPPYPSSPTRPSVSPVISAYLYTHEFEISIASNLIAAAAGACFACQLWLRLMM